jgi:hypothetical protein
MYYIKYKEKKIYDKPSSYQKLIANKLDIDISNDTLNIAGAKIYDVVQSAINRDIKISSATNQQINFGKKLGLDLIDDSMRVASAKINDELKARNIKAMAIEKMKLKPGDKVKKKEKEKIVITEHTVSSIGKNYKVYFKGGNRHGGWPTLHN